MDEETIIAVILAKAGFYGGDIDKVFNAPVDSVLKTYHYEMFTRDYEETYYELNKETK